MTSFLNKLPNVIRCIYCRATFDIQFTTKSLIILSDRERSILIFEIKKKHEKPKAIYFELSLTQFAK